MWKRATKMRAFCIENKQFYWTSNTPFSVYLCCSFLLSFDRCAMYYLLLHLKFSAVEIPFILLSMLRIELNRCCCCFLAVDDAVIMINLLLMSMLLLLFTIFFHIYFCHIAVCDYSSPPPLYVYIYTCSVATYCCRL